MNALVVLNPAARQHTAVRRWGRVAGLVLGCLEAPVVDIDPEGRWRAAVCRALTGGVRLFIAAGGDGTVGALADALAVLHGTVPLSEILLGAVGLGSSNDFHKPMQRVERGVPLRVDAAGATWRDLGRARWIDETGVERERIFIVSSSIGAVASANRDFNHANGLLRLLKERWVGGAILYAACRSIVRHRNLSVVLDSGPIRTCALTNLSIVKTPHLSGCFSYDLPVDPAGGLFGVHLAEGLSRTGLLALALSLARGRFAGRPHTRSWQAATLEVAAGRPFALELDGECTLARRARFDLLAEQLRVCT